MVRIKLKLALQSLIHSFLATTTEVPAAVTRIPRSVMGGMGKQSSTPESLKMEGQTLHGTRLFP